jgi:Putative zinc-finger
MRTIRCWQLRSVLTSYVDNEVSTGERLRVEDHLEFCAACRHRVSREQAVRQRLRRWSAEMRGEGVPSSWPAGADTSSDRRVGTLLRMAVVSTAAIALAVVMWNRRPADAGVAFAAHGLLTDSRCASGHTPSAPVLKTMSRGDCVRRCVEMGAHYVFVSQGVVYSIRNQGFADLTHLAGQDVQLEGKVRQRVLTVSQVRPLTARRSNGDLHSRIVRVSS